jgi:hypothetical protein
MNAVTLSSQQLKSLVEDKWQRDADAFAVGLHVANAWLGPNEVEFGFGKAQVVRADTVFQVREALRSAEQSKDRIILLTRLQQGDLGHDVVARLARSRLFTIDQWASLCALFKAKELDRSVCDPALAQALLDCAPADGYPPVSAGLLDAGTVWRAVCRHVFDMGEREPDLVTLLLWATSKAASTRFLDASDELQASLRQRLRCNLGDAADSILRFVESGAGADALALAVVCQVVFGDGSDSTLEAASARMEQFHNNKPISLAVGRVLGRTAVDAIADLDRQDDARLAKLHLDRADSLLQQLRCTDHTYRNRLTLRSYEQRMARFGDQITTAVASPSQEAVHDCERLQREIIDHRIAKLGRRAEQISRTEMAIRLVRWLSTGFSLPQSFSESANVYRKEIAFVDWARESVCRGDDVPELTKAYLQLDQAVLARREEFNRAFAQLLRAWTGEGSTSNDVCGVEDVLSQTVAQAAKADNRVLLIVLDGMSWAVCHELLKDIRQEHWFEATLDESSTPPTSVVATIPSVTRYSRTSLLSGVLASGDSFIEKRNFEANAELKQVCDKKYPPVLFHKSEVTDGSRGAVAEDLQKAILTPSNRVVGLVINAIDDTLSSAQQVRHNWNIDQISLLGPVLKLARDSGRVVIMASDHGHVWHRPDAKLCAGEAGTRWRHSSGEVQGGEITVTGSRVRDDSGVNTVIVPWTETIYYGKQQCGYHGGVTPQEMICPLVILTDKSSAYSGIFGCEYPQPEWWSAAPIARSADEEPAPPVPVHVLKGPPSLFDNLPDEQPQKERERQEIDSAKPSAWLERLFSSQAYNDQKEFVRRHAPEDEIVRRCLASLESCGGTMTPAAFSRTAAIPAGRLDGLVARIQRLLNVDGYEILTFSRTENRIELNIPKLKRQFDLD